MRKNNGLVTRTRTSITLPSELLKFLRNNQINITKKITFLLEKDFQDQLKEVGYEFREFTEDTNS